MIRATLASAAAALVLSGATAASATTWTWQDDFTDAAAFADRVAYAWVNFASFEGLDAPCVSLNEMLGPPDAAPGGCTGFASIGEGGVAVLEFVDNRLVGDGDIASPDLAVFEGGDHPEAYWVWVAETFDPASPLDMSVWTFVDRWAGDDEGNTTNFPNYLDIDWAFGGDAADRLFRYVMLWDDPDAENFGQGRWAGIDIDAVGALNSVAVPLPASALLLVAGLGGLAALRRRGA